MRSPDEHLLSTISDVQSRSIVVIRLSQLRNVFESIRIPDGCSIFDQDWLQLKQIINYGIINGKIE